MSLLKQSGKDMKLISTSMEVTTFSTPIPQKSYEKAFIPHGRHRNLR